MAGLLVAMHMRAWRRGRVRWGKSEEDDDGQAQQAPAAMEQDALAPPAMLRSSAAHRRSNRLNTHLVASSRCFGLLCSVGIWDIHSWSACHVHRRVSPALGSGIWIRRREDTYRQRKERQRSTAARSLNGLFLRPKTRPRRRLRRGPSNFSREIWFLALKKSMASFLVFFLTNLLIWQ